MLWFTSPYMLPAFPSSYAIYCASVAAILLGENAPALFAAQNLPNLFFGQFAVFVALASRRTRYLPALAVHIRDIISLRSKPEVPGIDAKWVITHVHHDGAVIAI